MNRTLVASLVIAAAAVGCRRNPPQNAQQPGMMQPGMMQPGMMQPGMMQPGMMQPGMMQPGMQPAGGGMVQVGGMVSGTLQQGDMALQDGSIADNYNVMLTAGQPVTVVVRGGPSMTTPGSNLDVYTLLLNAQQQELVHDDDSAGNLNSRIVYTPTMTGMYTIRVTTFGSGMKQGAYTLQVMPGANETAT
jgi:hypothetical protein